MTFTTDQLTYNKETQSFAIEASDVPSQIVEGQYVIYNPQTQMSQYFRYVGKDTDGEDIFGWRYKSHQGIGLLIIND